MMLLPTIILLEGGTFFLYPLLFGRPFSRADIQSRLTAAHAESEVELPPATAQTDFKKHILHPYLGFVANPGTYASDWEFSRGGQITTVNEYGFPGPPPLLKRQPDVVNICLLGGSFAMNLYLDSRETLANQLQRHDRFQGKKIQVALAAMSGWKQPQQLLALTYFLSQGAEFDVVVNLDGYNEVALPLTENLPAWVNSSFPRRWNLYATRSLPAQVLEGLSELARLRREKRERGRLSATFPCHYSRFCLFVLDVLERRARTQKALLNQALAAAAVPDSGARTAENSGPAQTFGGIDDVLAENADRWEDASRQMARLCRANGVGYVHFLQPNQYVPGSKPMSEAEQHLAWSRADNDPFKVAVQKGYPRLKERGQRLEEEGVRFVDLTMMFREITEPVYEDFCCHVNRHGNDLVAAKIADAIASLPPQ